MCMHVHNFEIQKLYKINWGEKIENVSLSLITVSSRQTCKDPHMTLVLSFLYYFWH